MRGLAVCTAVVCALVSATLDAQWLDYPTRSLPRLPDGKPDLTAAAPRRADGQPDLSGIWRLIPTTDPGFLGLPFGREFGNIGASLPAGLPYQPWAAEQVKTTARTQRAYDPLPHCLAIGPVRSHTITFYREMLHVSGKIVILNEYNTSYRQVFTDGRKLPNDPVPTVNGYSIGKWEGDTLVVETMGLRDGCMAG